MRKVCGSCGKPFEAKRAAAKYCGATCRKRASRSPDAIRAKAARSGAGPTVVEMGEQARDRERGPLLEATTTELEKAGRLTSPAGQAALALAQRIDYGGAETGSAMASLVREYRATMADALKGAEAANDELDQIRGSAALKLLRGGRAG
jgi:hypothetical protein